MILGYYNKSVWLTLAGTVIAVGGILASARGWIKWAIAALIVVGIIDLFDGVVARRIKRTADEQTFGVQLDSLADLPAFVALPISLGIALGLNTWWAWPLYSFYTIAAIQRLGYFNVTADPENRGSHYRGLPVTYAALILSWAWLFLSFVLPQHIIVGMAIVYLLTGVGFVLDLPVRKPSGAAYVVFIVLALLTGIALYFI
ncbi:MAG: CDP-alcohol phosphatidyltransferase family protein [Fastidiosipilaceae bacterium]|jgi:CDP-diacylglycerol--serine O-phosphatidyltransferase